MNTWILISLVLWPGWCRAIYIAFGDEDDPAFKKNSQAANLACMIIMLVVPVIFFCLGYLSGR